MINILFIFLKKKDIDIILFQDIIFSCLPFNPHLAYETINYLKEIRNEFIKINGKYPYELDKLEIKEEDIIELFIFEKGIKFKISAKYIIWNFKKEQFEYYLNSDFFMLFISNPYNCNYNLFTLYQSLKTSLTSIYKKMLKSEPIKKAMLLDDESIKLGYIFENEQILKEFEENVHLVVLPFSNYHGYTDKISFDIYLNIRIKNQSDYPPILSIFECF